VLSGLEHAADAEIVEVALRILDAAPKDSLDLRAGDCQALGQLLGRDLERDVLTEP
jgi:hypothetical protein